MTNAKYRGNTIKRSALLLVSLFCLLPTQTQADTADDLLSLSLEELMNIRVNSATLSALPKSEAPSSIIIISQEQIAHTPARNVRDLLEIYVPGLMFFDSSANGGELRIRGLGSRNYSTLLLVNGRPINQKSDQGSVAELNNWDMTDLHRIEVVMGPGSVTHGPGAISGVINLITKSAGMIEGFKIRGMYNPDYNSKGVSVDYGVNSEKIQWLAHFSIFETDGYEGLKIYQLSGNGEHGYKGTDAFSNSDANTVAKFYHDTDDKPQVKVSIDATFMKEWHFLARYTSAGNIGTVTTKNYLDGEHATHEFLDQHLLVNLENEHQFSTNLQLKSLISFDSENQYRTNAKQTKLNHNDILNRTRNYSENEWFLRSILNYQWPEKASISAGLEYSHDYLKKPWHKSANTFRAGSNKRNFITEDSLYRGNGRNGTIKDSDIVEFNDGWSANTFSLMAEFEYFISPDTRAIISARTDKNDFTKTMFSPRFALVSHLDENNTLKLSWQRSLRMNTMIELYIEELEGETSSPETIEGFELSYIRTHNASLHSTITAYQYDAEIISWSGTKSELVGKQKTTGIELELAYQHGNFTLGFNHSFLKLNDWNFIAAEPDGSTSQKVSLSDFFLKKDFLLFTSTGDSLTFWSDNTTKFWADIQIGSQLTLHFDTQVLWDLQYGDDLFTMYNNAYSKVDQGSLSPSKLEDYNAGLASLDDYNQVMNQHDPFGRNIRFNASIVWALPYYKNTQISLYGQNLINFDNNTRHKSINYSTIPVASWIEEPRAIWLTVDLTF